MHEHPSHELSKQAACSLTTKSYEEPFFSEKEAASVNARFSNRFGASELVGGKQGVGHSQWRPLKERVAGPESGKKGETAKVDRGNCHCAIRPLTYRTTRAEEASNRGLGRGAP